MEKDMAYTADVNRWRGPAEEPYRPRMLESPWHPGWIAVTILGFLNDRRSEPADEKPAGPWGKPK